MPKIAVILGSDSDMPLMKDCFQTLEKLGIAAEIKLLSAHRLPEEVADFSANAAKNGFETIICAAGLAAHLPGVTASYTTLPVIGVPIKSRDLEGMDALLSIVQMPPGIPVASVGVNNGRNAALLAAEILAIKHPVISRKLSKMRAENRKKLIARCAELRRKGWKKYLKKLADEK